MKNYDLHLPSWGPYNKKYLGAAHIADHNRGYRFDVNLFPGYYRRSVMTPRDVSDCGAKMMSSSVDVSHYVYRYELEWKDRVYLDADFCSEGNRMEITCHFVNETDLPESLTLNAVMSMQRSTNFKRELVDLLAVTGQGTRWLDAVDYTDISLEQKTASDDLLLGECRGSGFVGGSYIGREFFGKEGDSLHYQFDAVETDQIGFRYRGGGRISFEIEGVLYHFRLKQTDTPKLIYLEIPKQRFSSFTLLPHQTELDLDGFVFGRQITFDDGETALTPALSDNGEEIALQFGDLQYSVSCDCQNRVLRQLYTDDVGVLLSESIHEHVSMRLGEGGHCYVDLFLRPIFVAPHSRETVTLCITAPKSEPFCENHQLYQVRCNSAGEGFAFSQKIMSAVTLTNVVWPIYSRRGYIRHNTPGRNWDSLYTWDSGFVGLGLAQLDPARGEDCLNAYLTPVGDIHSPYILHGSPLPIQIFLFAELYQKTGDRNLIPKYYPMIRQQYRFFADARFNGRAKETGLFNTWDLFYNSGGWDDYPPQAYVHQNKLEDAVCPMINTSMTVLCAKILQLMGSVIGEDGSEYDADIEFYTNAVNTYAWDEASGYYGYVRDKEVLRIDGVNANMGLDGAYPYIAGISDQARSLRIVENIKQGMVTPIGVSVVDTRAPYYRTDGYWNGSIWMPHQWILWKAFLDQGELDLALSIADTALKLWKKETDSTYNCYEHFMIANGRGAGFHQFSGLSTPVLMWFHALYQPYTVTSGFLTLLSEQKCENNRFSFHVNAKGRKPAVIVCLEENREYLFQTSGTVRKIHDGTYGILFSHPVEETVEIIEQ